MSKEEQEQSEAKALNDSVLHSINSAGIGPRYAHPSKTLSSHGKTGKQLGQEFKDGDIVKLAKAGFGVYLQGDGLLAYDLQMMVCRGFVLRGIPTKVIGLAYLDHLAGGGDDWGEVHEAQVIGVRGWCEEQIGEGALSSDKRYRVDMALRLMLENNKALVLQSPKPITECNHWSQTLRELVADRTAPYVVKP